MNRAYDLTEPPGTTGSATGATEPQVKFLRSLLRDRQISLQSFGAINGLIENGSLSKRHASAFISQLKRLPYQERVRAEQIIERNMTSVNLGLASPDPDVLPKGRYAIENEDGELRFYHLWRGDRVPTYFKLYVQHGPNDSEIPFRAALTILNKIVATGPEACARRYGREIGACSQCDRRLTNRVSRMLDIGPVCGGRFRDDFKDEVAQAKRALRDAGLDPSADVEPSDDIDLIRERAGL